MKAPPLTVCMAALMAMAAPACATETCRAYVASANMTIAVPCPGVAIGRLPAVSLAAAAPVAAAVPPPPPTAMRSLHKARVNPGIGRVPADPRRCAEGLERAQLSDAASNAARLAAEACRR